MNLEVREIDERDFNFIGLIINDLYNTINKEGIEDIFVLENMCLRCYVVQNENQFFIYEPYYDNEKQNYKKSKLVFKNSEIEELENKNFKIILNDGITYEDKENQVSEYVTSQYANENYYGYNGSFIYSFKNIKNQRLYQAAYPISIYNGLKIYENQLNFPTTLFDYSKGKKQLFEYCTISRNIFLYLYHHLCCDKLTDFINLIKRINYINEMEGFYTKTPFKLGKAYTYEELSQLIHFEKPSNKIITLFNHEDEELNYYQEILELVLDYKKKRLPNHSKVYFKK